MSGRNITLLKVASGKGVRKIISSAARGGARYLEGAADLGSSAAARAGGGTLAKTVGGALGLGAAVAAPVLLARQTDIGRKGERAVGKGLGSLGRGLARAGATGERALTAKDWGSRQGETY